MSFMRAMSSGVMSCMAPGHLVDVALHELLAQLVDQLLELLPGLRRGELVLLEGLAPGRRGRAAAGRAACCARWTTSLGDLLAALVARTRRASRASSSSAPRSVSTTSRSCVGDLVVDAAEVVRSRASPDAAGAASRASRAGPGQLLAVAVVEARLQHPAQGRVEVAVVEQVVGDLGQHLVGVELEAHLGAVPARIAELWSTRTTPEEGHRPEATRTGGGPGRATLRSGAQQLGPLAASAKPAERRRSNVTASPYPRLR